jgi:undecaprenyl phosphate N,N'-diacetylbacillosamine 1-phosphate transferase
VKLEFALGCKRAADIVLGSLALVALLPAFALIALAIKLDSEGPVFFSQQRLGRAGQLFWMRKFRTLRERAEQMGSGLYVGPEDPRITRVGRFLRRFSLDELPQLLHVLTGDMSLVGPRPALPYQLRYYSPQHRRRLLMRPGMTGWSQVNGRNAISWPERLERDAWYVEHFSLLLDLEIALRTVRVWFSGEGLYGCRENFFLSGQDDLPVPSGEQQ